MSETKEVTIYGASDDLVELSGAIYEEFPHYRSGELLLAFNCGTRLAVTFDDEGCWRVAVRDLGRAEVVEHFTDPTHDGDYSERLTLRGDFQWVVGGTHFARAKREGSE